VKLGSSQGARLSQAFSIQDSERASNDTERLRQARSLGEAASGVVSESAEI